jgi:hypothetical protein
MKRPDLDTLACVNAECQLLRHAGANNLVIRKVYGHDRIRLLRCRTCGEEFSERRGTALSIPSSQRPPWRMSSTIWVKVVVSGPQPGS